jgi:putative transcriptional regulator
MHRSGMPMHRDNVLIQINELLSNHGFETSNIYDRSCFDMVARRGLLLLLLKVLINVDGFSGEQAQEIKKLAQTFLASPLIVGVKSKNEILEEDVVYERHGIPVIAPETLRDIVVEEVYPEVLADRGGYYVQMDGNIIKEVRERENLSLKELADAAHVSRETIYKYERGMVRAFPETAMILENILKMKITLSINLFEVPKPEVTHISDNQEKPKEMEPKELVELGFGVIHTHRTPFDAIAKTDLVLSPQNENAFITNMEKKRNYQVLKKMALNVKDLSDITGKEAVFIMGNKRNIENIEGIPVVHTSEIVEMENSTDFLRVLKERKECN